MTALSDDFSRVRPTIGRIVVKLMQSEAISRGGIILPGGRQEITTVGEVVEVCDRYADEEDRELGPMFSIGDKVIFGKYSGTELAIDREKYVVMHEKDVLATLHPQEKKDGSA